MDFDRLSVIPSENPPADPKPGEFWVPSSGENAGEAHMWSAKRGAWLNLFDDSIVMPKRRRLSWWGRLKRGFREWLLNAE